MAGRLRTIVVGFAVTGIVLLVLLVAAASLIRSLEARGRPAEAARLATDLGIGPGATVAEIGAGDGALAVEMARLVGARGRVIATELGDRRLRALQGAAARAGLTNVTVIPAGEHETNLPAGCCDAIYMRRVYHHLTDPPGVMTSALRALKPGARLGVVDFEPSGIGRLWTPRGVPERGGHGVPQHSLVAEMKSFGFVLRNDIVPWPDRMYLAVFERAASRSNTPLRRPMRQMPVFASIAFVD